MAEEKDGIALGYRRRKRSSDMQLYVGGQFLDFVSLKDAPGADDEGVDRGGGEMGPNLQVWMDKHVRFRNDGRH